MVVDLVVSLLVGVIVAGIICLDVRLVARLVAAGGMVASTINGRVVCLVADLATVDDMVRFREARRERLTASEVRWASSVECGPGEVSVVAEAGAAALTLREKYALTQPREPTPRRKTAVRRRPPPARWACSLRSSFFWAIFGCLLC